MNTDDHDAPACLARVRVDAENDPGALPRLLGNFQNLNLIPRRVMAEVGDERLHISIDVFGLSEQRLTYLVARFSQMPTVLDAYWHRLV